MKISRTLGFVFVALMVACGPSGADIACQNWRHEMQVQRGVVDAANARHKSALASQKFACAGARVSDPICVEIEGARSALIQEEDRLFALEDTQPEGC